MKMIEHLFKGRINRKNFILGFFTSIATLIVALLLIIILPGKLLDNAIFATIVSFFWVIIVVCVIVFNLSLLVRRWHDIGRSGWMIIFTSIPYIGFVVYIYLVIRKGDVKPNKYGPVPNKSV